MDIYDLMFMIVSYDNQHIVLAIALILMLTISHKISEERIDFMPKLMYIVV